MKISQDMVSQFRGLTTQEDARRAAELSSLTIIAGALLTFILFLTFLLHWFVGQNWANPSIWTSEETAYAAVAFLMAVVTAALEYKGSSAVVVTYAFIVARALLFAYLLVGESANTVNREDARVHQLSQSSPVFLATVASIKDASVAAATASASPSSAAIQAAGDKAKAQAVHANCKGEQCRKEAQSRIAQAEAKMQADAQSRAAGSASAATAITALAQSANSMAYDQRNHSAISKIFASWFGVEPLKIALFIAIIGIAAINLGLFAVGRSMILEKSAFINEPKNSIGSGAGFSGASSQSTPAAPATENQIAALNLVWNAIDTGKLTAIAVHDNSPMANLLSEAGHGTTNENRRDLMAFIVDALTREGVLMPNPDYQPGEKNGKRPKHLVNPNRVIKYGK